MKIVRMYTLALIILIGGGLSQPFWAMDVKAEFLKADKHFMTGAEPAEALSLYRAIVANGQNANYVRLSRFKIGIILDKQLMQYEDAMKAYQVFLDHYPNFALAKIARKNKDYLSSLQAKGALDDYEEYKRIEADHLRLMQKEGLTESEKEKTALRLYEYALVNYHQPFNEKLMGSALSATTYQRLFLHAQRIIELIDAEVPEIKKVYDPYERPVRVQARRLYATRIFEAYIGLCLIFILIKKGYRQILPDLKKHKWVYLIFGVSLLLYVSAWGFFSMTQDDNTMFDPVLLYFICGQSVILLPFSIAFYHSFSPSRGGKVKRVTRWVLSLLLGWCSWAVFGYHFDYMWLFAL